MITRDYVTKTATFYVAWAGPGANSYFRIFANREKADAAGCWDSVSEWRVGVTNDGDPVILSPCAPPYYDSSAQPVANVPFWSSDYRFDNRLVETGKPIKKDCPPDDCSLERWNAIRSALLGYVEEFG